MLEPILNQALETGKAVISRGHVATYIPELGKSDPNKFGICVFTEDGRRFEVGDTDTRFSIQSISKVISLAVALELCGFQKVFSRVGAEPSGDAFNSLIKLAGNADHPYNPMVNSGAITVCSLIYPEISFDEMLLRAREFCQDDGIVLDEKVFQSEMSTTSKNRAITYLLESKGVITTGVEETLEFYTKMCSVAYVKQL